MGRAKTARVRSKAWKVCTMKGRKCSKRMTVVRCSCGFRFRFFKQGESPMLFGDFQTWLNQSIGMVILAIVAWMYIIKKIAGSNSEVASALKGAATKKALGLISRIVK